MRLVIWNCNMAFDRKFEALVKLRPDIAIVSECANPDILKLKAPRFTPTDCVWVGENKHKGLSIFAFNGFKLEQTPDYDNSLKYIVPVEVSGPCHFSLLAVWAFVGSAHISGRHDVGAVNKAITHYQHRLSAGNTIMAGDFNNHVKWDKRGNPRNFADIAERLKALGMGSVYHQAKRLNFGEETDHTHYWRDRKEFSPFNCHIDYIFAPTPWLYPTPDFHIGNYADWCGTGLSDHVPLVLEFEIS
jgi:exodeoxyribonuclease III